VLEKLLAELEGDVVAASAGGGGRRTRGKNAPAGLVAAVHM